MEQRLRDNRMFSSSDDDEPTEEDTVLVAGRCIVIDCNRDIKAKNMCQTHYLTVKKGLHLDIDVE
jgi:hypothetical protein